jgi:hypothetical protein
MMNKKTAKKAEPMAMPKKPAAKMAMKTMKGMKGMRKGGMS